MWFAAKCFHQFLASRFHLFLALRGNARPEMSENIGLQSGFSKRPFPKKGENIGPQTTSELTHSKLVVSNRPGRRSLPSYTFYPF